jgi:hypothetical protein
MLSKQEEEQERIETLRNDLLVRQQQQNASTFHQHAQAQALDTAGGRFAATGAPRVIGSTPSPAAQYPAASAAHQTELPPVEPLGYSVDAMPGDESESPTGVPPVTSPVDTGPASDGNAPSAVLAGDEQRPGAGPLSSERDDG